MPLVRNGARLRSAEGLAIDLDSHTNNSCLVLAFEFTDTNEVFLFPADAQVGNWLSWQDLKWKVRAGSGTTEITGPDLLARTVFYKVGHHGSHNATLRQFGLEQMMSEELLAFIPVFEEEAKKNRWYSMPFPPLVDRLVQKTHGRLLKADLDNPKAGTRTVITRPGLGAVPKAVDATDLFFEYTYGG
jgi:hypothetical protein